MIAEERKLQLLATLVTLACLINLVMAAPTAPDQSLNPREAIDPDFVGANCIN